MSGHVRLVAHARWNPSDGDPPPLKRASLSGRALNALAARWAPHPEDTGLYQALGREKLILTARYADRARDGFAKMKATAPILEYSGYGPFTSLALEQKLRGPFWTLEADQVAGALALQQAMTDLQLGRCTRALVGSCGTDASATLLVLEAADAPSFRARFTWSAGRHDAAPDDPHGVRALIRGMEEKIEIALRTPEGRGITVRFTA